MSLISNIAESVREVNRKYAKPEIETTLFVKICLLTLRVYLLGMVGLMVYALIKSALTGGSPTETAPAAQTTITNGVADEGSASSTNRPGGQL